MTKLLFFTVILQSIFWVLLVPLWHTPDEQAHFAHVAFIAEGNDLSRHGRYPDMNEEIFRSLEILGTKRDEQGNNRFTFHPEYRLAYSQTLIGPEETTISNLPPETRTNLVIRESAYYPHFFYQISALIYRLVYPADLFVRVFSVRLFWLWAHWLMIYLVYKITQEIFPQRRLLVLTATVLAAMQPMLSFVAAGVTSDNLHNLLFTAVIYFSLKIIGRSHLNDWLGLALVLGLGVINKQQFSIAFAVILPAIIYSLFQRPKQTLKFLLVLPLSLLVALILAPDRTKHLLAIFFSGSLPYLTVTSGDKLVLPDYPLSAHIIWTLKHTVAEVLPWYWGVFNWLGVTLPRWVNRVLMRLLVAAGLGLIIYFIKRKLADFKIIFIAWSALIYFILLLIWDWGFTRQNGFPFGFQGRYYFPVISSHLILLTLGIEQLVSLINQHWVRSIMLLLICWFIFLQWQALYVVASSYYDVTGWQSFIVQASQYKPWFAKGWILSGVLISALISQLILLIKLKDAR
ncbi:MAG: DUF2142 domain-containing protein [Patescibacteria group bacterium]